MIMAAGLGTRMRPLTNDRPKPLVTVDGRTLLDHAIDRLKAVGVRTFVVNVHYKGEMVIDQVEGLARQLAKQSDAEMPRGRIEGSFSGMERMGDPSWKYDLRYLPNDTAIESLLRIHGKWKEPDEWSGEIAGDGMKGDFSVRSVASEYQAGLEFKGFSSSRMARVLNMFIDGRNDRYCFNFELIQKEMKRSIG